MSLVKIEIFGQVQGVGFRNFLKEKAKTYDIVGFARNTEEGTLYVEAGGPLSLLQQFSNDCRSGPLRAKVEKTQVEWLDDQNSDKTEFETAL